MKTIKDVIIMPKTLVRCRTVKCGWRIKGKYICGWAIAFGGNIGLYGCKQQTPIKKRKLKKKPLSL